MELGGGGRGGGRRTAKEEQVDLEEGKKEKQEGEGSGGKRCEVGRVGKKDVQDLFWRKRGRRGKPRGVLCRRGGWIV